MNEKLNTSLVLNWNNSTEERGGTEVVFDRIASLLNTKVISSQHISNLFGIRIDNYHHKVVDKSIIFDKYCRIYEQVNPLGLIIRNSGCGTNSKLKTKTITIFQDPYKWVADYFNIYDFNSIGYELFYTYPLFQKITGENSYNIANSNFMKKYMEEIGVECHKVIPLGVDLELFKPQKVEKTEEMKKYKKVGLWVGKFNNLKFNFIPELVLNNPDIYWVLVFTGQSEKKAKSENVKIYQNLSQEELAKLYNQVDFTISVSPVESFGLTSLESMACGTPIVAFKTGLFFDFNPSLGGVIVDIYELKSFQEAIERVLNKEWNPRAEAEKFDIKEFDKNILEVIEEVKNE